MEPSRTSYGWFAVQTRARYEQFVAAHLDAKGYQWLLPLYKCRRQWSDRIKELKLPLFPGYIFCRFNPLDRFPILAIPGVILVVGIGKNPIPVEDSEIAAIKTAAECGLRSQPWPFLQVGQQVRINYGPLFGLEGLLVGLKGHHRLVLSITLLRRSVAVEVDEAWVSAVPKPLRAPYAPATRQPLSGRLIA